MEALAVSDTSAEFLVLTEVGEEYVVRYDWVDEAPPLPRVGADVAWTIEEDE